VRQTSLKGQQPSQRLQLYGLVQGLSYVVRFNDFKTAQHVRAKLAWVLRSSHNLTKPQHHDLQELIAISGLWVRNVGNRHEAELQIRRLIRRIARRLQYRPVRRRTTKT
jgi:hypothetical protein